MEIQEFKVIKEIFNRIINIEKTSKYYINEQYKIQPGTTDKILNRELFNIRKPTLDKILKIKILKNSEKKDVERIINNLSEENLHKEKKNNNTQYNSIENHEIEDLKALIKYKDNQLKKVNKDLRETEDELLSAKQATYNTSGYRTDVTMKARIETNIINIDKHINELEYNLKTSNKNVIDYFLNNNVFEHNIEKLKKAIKVFEEYSRDKNLNDIEIV